MARAHYNFLEIFGRPKCSSLRSTPAFSRTTQHTQVHALHPFYVFYKLVYIRGFLSAHLGLYQIGWFDDSCSSRKQVGQENGWAKNIWSNSVLQCGLHDHRTNIMCGARPYTPCALPGRTDYPGQQIMWVNLIMHPFAWLWRIHAYQNLVHQKDVGRERGCLRWAYTV